MSTPFIGQITIFSFAFPPRGWALCNGQLLPINQNQALFSLLGTQYGGDGRVNFALPNMQGDVAIGMGQGQGLTNRTIGEVGGEQNHTLLTGEMAPHKHTPNYGGAAASMTPGGQLWAADPNGNVTFATSGSETLAPQAIGNTGGSQAHNNMEPYLILNFCIALQGIFPSRN
jgi:microcystin-dependent protein